MTLFRMVASRTGAAALSLAIFVPGSLVAQAGTEKPPVAIPPVEIVATRIPESPHAVPASIEVIDGNDLRARGVKSLRDALALAAGVARRFSAGG